MWKDVTTKKIKKLKNYTHTDTLLFVFAMQMLTINKQTNKKYTL